MHQRWFASVFFSALAYCIASASELPAVPFVDGLWSGGIQKEFGHSSVDECWARTTFHDGTTLSLSKQRDGNWRLLLSNPGWHLPDSHRYDMAALVDFYPPLRVVAVAKSRTGLEIADLDQISLLGLIENGHTINLKSDGFEEKFDLEGSAKAIERVRNCIPGQGQRF